MLEETLLMEGEDLTGWRQQARLLRAESADWRAEADFNRCRAAELSEAAAQSLPLPPPTMVDAAITCTPTTTTKSTSTPPDEEVAQLERLVGNLKRQLGKAKVATNLADLSEGEREEAVAVFVRREEELIGLVVDEVSEFL